MSTDYSIRVPKGTLTMGQLSDYNKSLYITNLSEYYKTEFMVNKHNGKTFEKGKLLNRRVRESIYDFLMETFSKEGKEPRDISSKILAKYDPDEFYDELVQLDGIGPKYAILSTIALTGVAPSIVKNLANDVANAMFVSSDKSTIVSNCVPNLTPCPGFSWSYRDDYSTSLAPDVAENMLQKFSEIVRENSGFREEALPTKEEIMSEVRKQCTLAPGDRIMLKSQKTLEDRLVRLCKATSDVTAYKDEDQYIDMLHEYALDSYQRNSVDMVINGTSKLYTITGKAGVGKSHVITYLYRAYSDRCVLTAYQNSACDVLSRRVGGYQFCGQPIKAIIGLSMKLSNNAKFAEAFRKYAHVIIVDESSQIGTVHLGHIFNILDHAAPDAKLVFVGDVLQTRPVCTYGMPFVHLVRSGLCPTADLAEFHRTNGRGILSLCEQIRAAHNENVYIEPGTEGVELQQIPENDKYIYGMCRSIADEYYDAKDDITKYMVIAETNAECDMINRLVTAIIFHDSVVETGLPRIRKDMVVVSTDNKQSTGWKITNGTRYYIKDIDDEYIYLVDCNNEQMRVPKSVITSNTFKVAYAITVHKSQGSEATNVHYVFHRHRDFSNAFACDKTLKYVAFSRAQESLTLHEIFNPLFDKESDRIVLPLLEQPTYYMSF